MNVTKHLYETVFVLNPELTEEDVEANIQSIVQLLESKGAEIIRMDRGGKRRLAYVMRKQRYGYYTLIHFRATPEPLPELERMYRLSERVLRYLTVRFDKEEHLTGFTRVPDDDGREEDRDDRRRGDDVASLSRGAVKGATHGVVPWTTVALTVIPDDSIPLSL